MSTRDVTHPEMQSRMLSIMRIMIGLMYVQSGTAKLFHFPFVRSLTHVAAGSLPWWGGIVELVCGTLVVLGLFTRPAAFLASGEMAVAYWVVLAPRGFFPAQNGGALAVTYCFAFLYLAVAGGGAWSLDRFRETRRIPRLA